MNVLRGRIQDGHVELDSALPDGEAVVILAETQPFDRGENDIAVLAERMTAAGRREVEPARSSSRWEEASG